MVASGVNSGNFNLGYSASCGISALPGYYDNVKIWSGALTAAQVLTEYTNTRYFVLTVSVMGLKEGLTCTLTFGGQTLVAATAFTTTSSPLEVPYLTGSSWSVSVTGAPGGGLTCTGATSGTNILQDYDIDIVCTVADTTPGFDIQWYSGSAYASVVPPPTQPPFSGASLLSTYTTATLIWPSDFGNGASQLAILKTSGYIPAAETDGNYLMVRFYGRCVIPSGGNFKFSFFSDNGNRLWVSPANKPTKNGPWNSGGYASNTPTTSIGWGSCCTTSYSTSLSLATNDEVEIYGEMNQDSGGGYLEVRVELNGAGGYQSFGPASGTLPVCYAGNLRCGDGKTRFFEQCDDGNSVSGDGCDNKCQVETSVPGICCSTQATSTQCYVSSSPVAPAVLYTTTALRGYWKWDSNLVDTTGTALAGTNTGGLITFVYDTVLQRTVLDSGAYSGGADRYITIPRSLSWPKCYMTLAVWVRLPTPADTPTCGSTPFRVMAVFTEAAGIGAMGPNLGYCENGAAKVIPEWYTYPTTAGGYAYTQMDHTTVFSSGWSFHVLRWGDGGVGRMALDVNGRAVGDTNTVTGIDTDWDFSMYLFGYPGWSRNMVGRIGPMRLWSGSMTDADALDIYTNDHEFCKYEGAFDPNSARLHSTTSNRCYFHQRFNTGPTFTEARTACQLHGTGSDIVELTAANIADVLSVMSGAPANNYWIGHTCSATAGGAAANCNSAWNTGNSLNWVGVVTGASNTYRPTTPSGTPTTNPYIMFQGSTNAYTSAAGPGTATAVLTGVICERKPGTVTSGAMTITVTNSFNSINYGPVTLAISFLLPQSNIPIGETDVFVFDLSASLFNPPPTGVTASASASAVAIDGTLTVSVTGATVRVTRSGGNLVRGNLGTYTITLSGIYLGPAAGTFTNNLGISVENSAGRKTYLVGTFALASQTLFAPTVTAVVGQPQTATGGTITLLGTNFGPAADWPAPANSFLVGTVSCTSGAGMFDTASSIRCTMPAGIGGGITVTYQERFCAHTGCTTTSMASAFSYKAPSITSVTQAATAGGTITVNGDNFGISGTAQITAIQITAGATTTLTCGTMGWFSATSVTCVIPAGSGSSLDIRITVGGQINPVSKIYSYKAPTITAMVAINGAVPTTQLPSYDSLLTIYGTDFGAVYPGTTPAIFTTGTVSPLGCPLTATPITLSMIICNIPAGVGKNVVTVTAGETGYGPQTASSLPVTYAPPTISYIDMSKTVGQTVVVYGTNFGGTTGGKWSNTFYTADVSTTASTGCTRQTDTWINCVAPQGIGAGKIFSLTVASVVKTIAFSYIAPTITSVTKGSTSGTDTITMNGDNFGFSGTGQITAIQITAGATTTLTCGTMGWFSATSVTCVIPAGSGSGLDIRITVGGQINPTSKIYSYKVPTITSMVAVTGAIPTNPLPAFDSLLTIYGTEFGTAYAAPTPAIFTGGSASPMNCLPTVTPTWSMIICNIPAGVGSGHVVTVTAGETLYGPQTVASASFSYKSPTISYIDKSATVGQTVTLYGDNFGGTTGSFWSNAYYKADVDTTASTGCTRQSDTWINCVIPQGVGLARTFYLTVAGVVKTIAFSYKAPVVTVVTQPSTEGNVPNSQITLYGSDFGFPAGPNPTAITFTTPSSICTAPTYIAPSMATCMMPPGTGAKIDIRITIGAGSNLQDNGANTLLSYKAPAITAVLTVNGDPLTAPIKLPSYNALLTIWGTDFGPVNDPTSSAFLFGGASVALAAPSKACVASVATYSMIVCALPAGPGGNWKLVVTQGVAVGAAPAQITQSSTVGTMTYAAPKVTWVQASVTAGQTITILGDNFGGNTGGWDGAKWYSPSFGPFPGGTVCASSAGSYVNDTMMLCQTPMGEGNSHNFTLMVDTAWSTLPASFTYLAPFITSLSPIPHDRFQSNLTLYGTYFGVVPGTPLPLVGTGVFGGAGFSCLPAEAITDSKMVCVLPASTENYRLINITVAGQTSNSLNITYVPANITAISPATLPTTGGTLTVFGNNFAHTAQMEINIGSPSQYNHLPHLCTVTSVSVNRDNLTCAMPEGVGGSKMVTLTVGPRLSVYNLTAQNVANASQLYPFTAFPAYYEEYKYTSVNYSYTAPNVTATTRVTTEGGITTLFGTNFGTYGSLNVGPLNTTVTATIDGSVCSQATWVSDTTITCVVVPGAGTQHSAVVVVGNQTSPNNTLFSYLRPTLTLITPANGPVRGNTSVTLFGTNFAPALPNNRNISIGGTACNSFQYVDHRQIVCLTPPGFYYLRPVVITVSGQMSDSDLASGPGALSYDQNISVSEWNSTNRTIVFSYDRPVVTAVVPATGPAVGQTSITLIGLNFGAKNETGQYSAPYTALAGTACTSATWLTDTTFTCLTPEGVGTGAWVYVNITYRDNVNNTLFTYRAPTITAVVAAASDWWTVVTTPPPVVPWQGSGANGTKIVRVPSMGGTTVTLVGLDFGLTDHGAFARVNGNPCVPAGSAWLSDSYFKCQTPPFIPPVGMALLDLTVGNQTGTNQTLVAYYPHWNATAVNATKMVGPARGGYAFNMTGWGFNVSDGYRCVFKQVGFPNNTAKSLNVKPVSDTTYTCTTPEWLYTHALTVVTLEDSLGNTLDQFGSVTYDFWEDFDFVYTFSTAPGVDVTMNMMGGGYNMSDCTYRCLLSNTSAVANASGPIYLASKTPVCPAAPNRIVCVFTGPETFPWGTPLRVAQITIHSGLDPNATGNATVYQNLSAGVTNHTRIVRKSSDGEWGNTCCRTRDPDKVPADPGTKGFIRPDWFYFVNSPPLKPAMPWTVLVTPFSISLKWKNPTMAELGGVIMTSIYLMRNGTNVTLPGKILFDFDQYGDATTTTWGCTGALPCQPAGWFIWPETAYSFQLIFNNALGDSPPSDTLEVVTPPSVPLPTMVTPSNGRITGGREITISGFQFNGTTSVSLMFGNTSVPCVLVAPATPTQIRCKTGATPSGLYGPFYVEVVNGVGAASQLASAPVAPLARPTNTLTYLYNRPPNVTAILPAAVPRLAPLQAPVTITLFGYDLGQNFGDVLSVAMPGGLSCVNITYLSSTNLWCSLQPSPVEQYGNVTVTTYSADAGAGTGIFWYTSPWAAFVTPQSGTFLGGSVITVTGQWLGLSPSDVVSVEIGPKQYCLNVVWSTIASNPPAEAAYITCVTPESFLTGVDGVVPVVVTTVSGGSGHNARSDRPALLQTYPGVAVYTFDGLAPPNVTAVVPNWGTILGGEVVTVYGTNLGLTASDYDLSASGNALMLSGIRCPSFVWVSRKQVICRSAGALAPLPAPAWPPYPIPVPVPIQIVSMKTLSAGATTSKDSAKYWYRWPVPSISRVAPRVSSDAGGAAVTLEGNWYLNYNSKPNITMNGIPCTSSTWVSDNFVVCRVPSLAAHGGTIKTLVSTPVNFQVTIEGQASNVMTVPFMYGIECTPACGWEGECEPDATGSPRCVCHRYWSNPPACDQSVVKVTNLTERFTSEDKEDLAFTISLNQQPVCPGGGSCNVVVSLYLNDTSEAQIDGMSSDPQAPTVLTFTSTTWNQPLTYTARGQSDTLRDGDVRWGLVFTSVVSKDINFDAAPVPSWGVPNYDAAPVIRSVDRDLSAKAGSNRTIVGDNFDPFISLETWVTKEDYFAAPKNVSNLNKTWFVYETDDGATRFSSLVFRTNLSAPPSETIVWKRVVGQLPPQAGGYYVLVLRNMGNGVMPPPARGTAIYKTPIYYTDDCPDPGSYGRGNDCRPCPEGAICPGGDRMWPKQGYWNPNEGSGYVVKCDNPNACPGQNSGLCGKGYTSACPSCSDAETPFTCACCQCDKGYAPDATRPGTCAACPQSASLMYLLVANVGLWLLVAMAGWWLRDYENLTRVSNFVLAVQQIGALGVPSRAPAMVVTVFNVLYMFSGNVSFLKADCFTPTPFHLVFVSQLAYNVGIAMPMLLGMYVVKWVALKRIAKFGPEAVEQRRSALDGRHIRLVTLMFSVSYLSIATLCINATLCNRKVVNGNGRWELYYQKGYPCYRTWQHFACLGASAILGLGFVIGYPLWYTKWTRSKDHIMKIHLDLKFRESWNLLIDDYKDNRWWWYFNEFFIGILIACSGTVLTQNPNLQVATMAGVFALSMLLMLLFRPFENPWNALRFFGLQLTNFCGVVYNYIGSENTKKSFKFLELQDKNIKLLGWGFLGLSGAVILGFMVCMIYNIFWFWQPKRRVQGSADYWMNSAVERHHIVEGMKASKDKGRRMSVAPGATSMADELADRVFGDGEFDIDELEEINRAIDNKRVNELATRAANADQAARDEIRAMFHITPDMMVDGAGDGVFFDSGEGVEPLPPPPVLVTQENMVGSDTFDAWTRAAEKIEGAILSIFDRVQGKTSD